MSTTTATAGGANELKRNVLGLPSAMVMSIAFISPTIGVIFISALIGGQAGISSPFAFILGTLSQFALNDGNFLGYCFKRPAP